MTPWQVVEEGTPLKILASDGFLKLYIDYLSTQTEAPKFFHLATALSILGTAMADRIKSPFYAGDIYPNTYTTVVAPTGFYYKSTAIGKGVELLARAAPDLLLPQQFSPEALVETLSNRAAAEPPVVATLEMPIYFAASALGMRSVAKAQFLLRKIPIARPIMPPYMSNPVRLWALTKSNTCCGH